MDQRDRIYYKGVLTGAIATLVVILAIWLVRDLDFDRFNIVFTVGERAKYGYKIGVVTPAHSVSADESRGAEKAAKRYPGLVKHVELSENFQHEQKEGRELVMALAADPEVQAIVICADYEGLLPALSRINRTRPEVIIIAAPIWDNPDEMTKYIDLCLDTSAVSRGTEVVRLAYKMGARTFIHYSYPSHMKDELLTRRMRAMRAQAENLGMVFAHVETPDPATTANSSTEITRFLSDDIPKRAKAHGKDTAIFGTACDMQETIIEKCVEQGLVMPGDSCGIHLQHYPEALGIDADDSDVDIEDLNNKIKREVALWGNKGRMANWPVPFSIFGPEFGVEVARMMLDEGLTAGEVEALEAKAKQLTGTTVKFEGYRSHSNFNNFYYVSMDSVIY